MKKGILKIILLVLFVAINTLDVFAIDKKEFYEAFSGSSLEKINRVQVELEKETNTIQKNAYLGALLMKKAGVVKPVLKKLNLFKEGHQLLEKAITKKPFNAEYRFLRFVIQENAPVILNYRKNIEEDKKIILESFSGMANELKLVIIDYVKLSQRLSEEELV